MASKQIALPLDQSAYFKLRYGCLVDAVESKIAALHPFAMARLLKNSPPTNLLKCLHQHQVQVHDFSVPFDNNTAERDVHMIKVQ